MAPNITRASRPAPAIKQFKPGDNPSIPSVSRAEYSTAEHSDARRAAYRREDGKAHAEFSAERARLNSETD